LTDPTTDRSAGPARQSTGAAALDGFGPFTWRDLLGLGVAVGLLTILSVYQLGARSFWRDEVSSVVFASASLPDLLTIIDRERAKVGVPNMATYYVVLHFWLAVGETEARIRFLSVLFGVATTVPVFLVARRIGGTTAAILAALAFASSSVVIIWSQEARGYSLAMLVAAVLTLLVLHATERQRTWMWAAYGVVAALGIYVHFFVAFVIAAHGLWVLLTRSWPRRWPGLVAVLVPLVLSVAPLPIVAASLPGAVGWVPSLTLSGARVALRGLAGSDMLLIAVVVLAGFAVYTRRSDRRVWLVLGALLVPILGAAIISLAKPVFLARYLVVATPAIAMMLGVGLASIRPRVLGAAAILVVVILAAVDLPSAYRDRHQQDWRAAGRELQRAAIPGDAIAYVPDASTRRQIEYYLERFDAPVVPVRTSLNRMLAGDDPPRLWVVALRPSGAERDALRGQLSDRYEAVMDAPFGGRLRMLLFERRDDPLGGGCLLRSGGSHSCPREKS